MATNQETNPMPTTTDPTFAEATCDRCGQIARLTRAGWRHGWPPAGHDGHCPGTAFFPDVAPVDTPDEPAPWRLRLPLVIGIITRSAAARVGHGRPDEQDLADALTRLDAALPGGLDYLTHLEAMAWIYEPDTF